MAQNWNILHVLLSFCLAAVLQFITTFSLPVGFLSLIATALCLLMFLIARENTHAFTQMFTRYNITSHTDFSLNLYCLVQTIRAKSDLLQRLAASHYPSVIPHLPIFSSTPASPLHHSFVLHSLLICLYSPLICSSSCFWFLILLCVLSVFL